MKKSYIKRKKPMKRTGGNLKRTPIRRVSKKQASRLNQYSKARKIYLEAHQLCEVCGSAPAGEIHHKARRGSNTANSETFTAICRPCHNDIHANPSRARENGWLT